MKGTFHGNKKQFKNFIEFFKTKFKPKTKIKDIQPIKQKGNLRIIK